MKPISLIENAYFNEILSVLGLRLGGCLFLTFLLGIHWGSVRFSPKMVAWAESLQVPSENKILMIFWLLVGERLSILLEYSHRSLQQTHSQLSHLVCFILLKEWCSPTLTLFQRASLSQPQQPCQEKKMKGQSVSYLEISRSVLPQLKMEKERGGERGGVAGYHGYLTMTFMPITEGFLSQVSVSSDVFGARHSLEMIDIPYRHPMEAWCREITPGKSGQCSNCLSYHTPLRISLL